MKFAVYTIALNEEQFVERWYESAKDADYILIADTGSTDGTFEKALDLNIHIANISINPWRFDDSRNAALALIPSDIDYCVVLDMDEVLVTGWRQELEKSIKENPATVYNCRLTWNYHEDGTPGLQYGTPRIHARKGYRWTHPIHEIITYYGDNEVRGWTNVEIGHLPDSTKSRSSYLPLLKMAVKEDPHSDRNAFYYARELFFYEKYEEAAQEFIRHLSLPTSVWKPERAASYRYLAQCRPNFAEEYLKGSIAEDPTRREGYVSLSELYYKNNEWEKCFEFAEKALSIKQKDLNYFCEDFAWGALPFDLAAISAYHLDKNDEALYYGQKAVDLSNEQRLKDNLKFYKSKVL